MLGAARAGTPMVFVDRWIPGVDVPVVRSDGRAAVRDLVAHLHGLGHRRLAIIAGPAATTTGRERVDAFREALAAFGLELPDAYIGQGDFQAGSGRRVTEGFLDLPVPPEAVFAADNLMALGALDAIRARGLRVPDDIALAAFDDIPGSCTPTPGHRDRPAHPRPGAGGRTRPRRPDRRAARRVGHPSRPARRAPLVRRGGDRATPSPSPVRRSTP